MTFSRKEIANIFKETSTRPIYLWVEKQIKKLIADGTYAEGEKIPSERDLAREMQISRVTVRKAIENLCAQGLVERRASSGTFVKSSSFFPRPIGFERPLGLSERLRRWGSQAGSILLYFNVEVPSPKIIKRLLLDKGEAVLKIRRLRTAANLPICIETTYIPKNRVPDLYVEDLLVPGVSLYDVLRQRYEIVPESSEESIRIAYATDEEAHLLGLKAMDPVLLLRCITSDTNQHPFEYLVSVNHPDRVIFESHIKNQDRSAA